MVCEKAATSVDAFRMVTASRYYPQLMSLVGNVLRFLPAFVRMKQLIAEHYVGAVMIWCLVAAETLMSLHLRTHGKDSFLFPHMEAAQSPGTLPVFV